MTHANLKAARTEYKFDVSEMIPGAIVEHISTGVIFVDESGVIVFVNSRAEQSLNVTKEEVIGKRVDMLPLRIPLYKVLSENSRDYNTEMSVNGSVLLVKTSQVAGRGGLPGGELVEIRDITEEKRERRQREEFVAMMTHDLKSPLTVMMGYIQAIRGGMFGKVEQSVLSSIGEIDRSSKRLLGMIEDVLDAYRLEVGLLSIIREVSDIGDLVDCFCREISREAESEGIVFTYSIAENIPAIRVDRKQIVRVFSNLLGNAFKFTPRGGNVSLTLDYNEKNVVLAVTDTGVGISDTDIGRIFNKYYRANSAAGYKGTGLGLAITKAIVDAHNGYVHVESREGEGSRFSVVLPLF